MMLLVRTEYKKGVFFVRLMGRLDNEGDLDKIINLIEEIGLKYTVLNLTKLYAVSLKNKKYLLKSIRNLQKKNLLLLVCDENVKGTLLYEKVFPKLKNEIEVFSLIKRKDAYEW